jgi:hypothetical protein
MELQLRALWLCMRLVLGLGTDPFVGSGVSAPTPQLLPLAQSCHLLWCIKSIFPQASHRLLLTSSGEINKGQFPSRFSFYQEHRLAQFLPFFLLLLSLPWEKSSPFRFLS